MTPSELKAAEARAAKATEGPWHWEGDSLWDSKGKCVIACSQCPPRIGDKPLLSESRTDLPAALEMVRRLGRAAIETLEMADCSRHKCLICEQYFIDGQQHPPGLTGLCPLAGWSVADLEEKP